MIGKQNADKEQMMFICRCSIANILYLNFVFNHYAIRVG